MRIKNISIRNFRNLVPSSVPACAQTNILIGNNGHGKTNFLETIFFSLKGKSFRPGTVEKCYNTNGNERAFSLATEIEQKELINRVKITSANQSKQIILNDKKTTPSKLTEKFSCVLFSPDSLFSIKGPPELRRDLIDGLIESASSSAGIVSEFQSILKQRNRLLREIAAATRGGAQHGHNLEMLSESIDEKYLELAVALVVARLDMMRKIKSPLAEITKSILNEEKLTRFDYRISEESCIDYGVDAIYSTLRHNRDRLRIAERASGISLFGPHKHDVQIIYGEKDSRYYCSQGQQRSLILAFKLAEIRLFFETHGFLPILLLDDVMSELDKEKRHALILFLKETKLQTFITTTELPLPKAFSDHELMTLSVKNGQILSVC